MAKKVLVAMSGGVDSSVAAFLLKQDGYDVSGVTMCLGISNSGDDKASYRWVEAIRDAKRVCGAIGIAHYAIDFSKEMEDGVVQEFIAEYMNGRTPNPCVRCNELLKFGKLYDFARLEYDYFATGHFARIVLRDGQPCLAEPKDNKKDQTYFLYSIKRECLPHIVFPLADYTKEEVRDIARKAGLPVAEKVQSQDICFVLDGDYKKFLASRGYDFEEGDLVSVNGEVIGKHSGIGNYTIGQRRGIGVASEKPYYVISLNGKKREVVVGTKEDLYSKKLCAGPINMLVDEVPEKVSAKIRYGHEKVLCSVTLKKDGKADIVFDEKQEAITPGQSVVFYEGDIVVGGGIIL